MKIFAIALASGLILAILLLFGVVHQHGVNDAKRDSLAENIQQNESLIAELRRLAADARGVLAEVRAADQARQAAGEKRRDEMQKTMLGDPCANTAVPAAIADGLRKRIADTDAADLFTGSGQPDTDDTHASVSGAVAVGPSRNVGR